MKVQLLAQNPIIVICYIENAGNRWSEPQMLLKIANCVIGHAPLRIRFTFTVIIIPLLIHAPSR
jgi:hypothetical protein